MSQEMAGRFDRTNPIELSGIAKVFLIKLGTLGTSFRVNCAKKNLDLRYSDRPEFRVIA
jgi:hypothetical protein